MLQCFFEDARGHDGEPKDNRCLFEGLDIMSAGDKYLAHMGQYPVIFLTLKGAKQPDFPMAYAMLKRQIAKEFERHAYILKSERRLLRREKYTRLMMEEAPRGEYNDAIAYLSECLEIYYGKKVIILIDEYDVPLQGAFEAGFYDEMVGFIRSLFESAFKTNGSLEFAVITGCLRISSASFGGAQESIFTGLNNLEVNSILSANYDEYFGFTDAEVKRMCQDYGLLHKYEDIRDWYNGYVFGEANIYNPWSLILYVKDLLADGNSFPKSYWANTSSNSIVRDLIDRADDAAREDIERLITGEAIEKPVHEDVTYGEVYDDLDNLWNFMFFTGYFRKVSERIGENDVKYLTMTIPNREVRYIFSTKIRNWFDSRMKQRDMSRLHGAFIGRDAETVEEELNDILLETISSLDAGENYYHGLVAGLLTGIKGYVVKSNREGGKKDSADAETFGRSDLFVKPVSRRKEAFIVEFKMAKRFSELDARADEALAQIVDRQYDRELRDDEYSIISHYGIAFCGKECRVRLMDGGQT